MRGFIVAMENLGARLGAGPGGRRIPVCEHAYDLETATLAGHPSGHVLRVGFPSCQRGWNSQPQAVRCPDCDTAVQRMARDLIATAIAAITGCLPPPSPDPS
jgi:ssDNA-binding Zn-finger/Zn-ribbon topoisomerase 1